jgi:MtfA peptidase
MVRLLNGWRRERLRRLPLPAEWERHVERNVVFFDRLASADRRELFGHTQILLAEKHFEGCDGLELTDEIRVTVAAYAAMLLLHRDTDYYPRLTSILVYPGAYVVRGERYRGDGLWEDEETVRLGETGARLGAVVVTWEDIPRERSADNDGRNVVLHEFAHQLDYEDGAANGAPLLEFHQRADWERVFTAEYEALCSALDADLPIFLRPYAAKNRAEFFAVATELFFHRADEFRRNHAELYQRLADFYRQDPAEWTRRA